MNIPSKINDYSGNHVIGERIVKFTTRLLCGTIFGSLGLFKFIFMQNKYKYKYIAFDIQTD